MIRSSQKDYFDTEIDYKVKNILEGLFWEGEGGFARKSLHILQFITLAASRLNGHLPTTLFFRKRSSNAQIKAFFSKSAVICI